MCLPRPAAMWLVVWAMSLSVWAAAAAAPPAASGAKAPGAATAPASQPAAPILLSESHPWRKHYTFFPPALSVKATSQPTSLPSRRALLAACYSGGFETPPPPAGWTAPDFDDGAWLVHQGRQFVVGDGRAMEYLPYDATDAYLRGTDPFIPEVGLIGQRGRFLVHRRADLKKLTLSITYRGGFVAWLNGIEIGRASLPAGALEPATPADDYPLEAFFVADGGRKGQILNWYSDRTNTQWPLRERTARLDVPLAAVRDGVNVLAMEFHRSDYPNECRAAKSVVFATLGLSLLELRAEMNAGATPAATPAADRGRDVGKGVLTWNGDPTDPGGEGSRPTYEAGAAVARIVAVRNGAFSALVMVGSEGGLSGLTASPQDLTQKGGKGKIPASAVSVRYAAPNPLWPPRAMGGKAPPARLDLLLDSPPPAQADKWQSAAVWVSVTIPRDCPPGAYAGELLVGVNGQKLPVPVEVELADWTLPDVKDYASLINIYQSPDTLAQYYKHQPWSAQHWAKIEKSLALMGRAGNIGLFIPLLAETQMGNPESMVVWRKGGDGYTYDFDAVDRYVDAALKTHTRLRFVSLNVWGPEAGLKDYADRRGALVTVIGADGQKSAMKLPAFDTPEAEAMWKPLLTALAQRLSAKGLEGKLLLGLPPDGAPEPAAVAMFHRILPQVAWIRESHFNIAAFLRDGATKATVPVAYNSIVWGGDIPHPAAKRLYGWQRNERHLVMTFNRAGTICLTLNGYPPPWSFRMWMESTLACGRNGNGRVGGDYWRIGAKFVGGGPVNSEAVGGSSGTLFGIYLASGVGQVGLGNTTTDLFGPGADGPVTTIRFENALEGNQEAEARVFIEKALLNKAKPLPEELARRCQQALDERTTVLRMWAINASELARANWPQRTARLFALAAEVASDQ